MQIYDEFHEITALFNLHDFIKKQLVWDNLIKNLLVLFGFFYQPNLIMKVKIFEMWAKYGKILNYGLLMSLYNHVKRVKKAMWKKILNFSGFFWWEIRLHIVFSLPSFKFELVFFQSHSSSKIQIPWIYHK